MLFGNYLPTLLALFALASIASVSANLPCSSGASPCRLNGGACQCCNGALGEHGPAC
ncbi:hypothetical protein PGT21_003889 [Puccinia graminis f. sp. tritici]|uniref:Uncharacterized protein n=2 Tax=Puccinia graminis f. sp. tritici TaxID=56615 RepID=H6QUG8_PUCGT|nr:uncharacterized protein PGTG_22447 [Puccinia graminis f. sp. tritici CRL 75-36-700-3]EHS64631.1 hypothetical protein PGTG_22447 [Puccinia graminis f. sp. tritici CRL 75-36-700-3]KAA1088261.1 hypothetical protein PGTUg99_030053 [Puccinia graminis f. sp. tritici]KAA1112625.1 hypothetical protein PGT21_003889 [Puccinia graminis f. sp. tritici]